jgi:hypothetical protein
MIRYCRDAALTCFLLSATIAVAGLALLIWKAVLQ